MTYNAPIGHVYANGFFVNLGTPNNSHQSL